MALLTDLPAELRQHIIRLIPGSTPDEIQLSHTGWPAPVKQLLATCKLLRADTIHLMGLLWSFDCLIPRSGYIKYLPRLCHAMKGLGLKNRVQKVRLLIFGEITMAHVRAAERLTRSHVRLIDRIRRMWVERSSDLPRGDIKTVVVDITPLPRSMLENHPNLVNANLMDAKTAEFFSEYGSLMSIVMNRLNEHFNPAVFELTPIMWRWETTHEGELKVVLVEEAPYMDLSVHVAVGGQVGAREGSRVLVEELQLHGGISPELIRNGAAAFVGTYCDEEIPVHLSLHRLVQRCGIRLKTSDLETDYKLNVSGITLLEDIQENEVEPGKDFTSLSPLNLSKYSTTAYYNDALDDKEAARKVVVKLLSFAVDCRESLNKTPYLDFLSVSRPRHRLVRELSRDLGLVCGSIDGKYGNFCRVSSLVDEVSSRLNDFKGRDLEQQVGSLSLRHSVEPAGKEE